MADDIPNDQLARLEELALLVDRLEEGTEDEQVTAGAKRQRLLIELDVYGLLTGEAAVGRMLADFPTLLGYHEACVEMAAYHASPERARLVRRPPPARIAEGHVSLDWFRVPSDYVPADVSPADWLALCEINFLDPMPEGAGTRFVYLEGELHVLEYRIEATGAPVLWRALPDGGKPPRRRDADISHRPRRTEGATDATRDGGEPRN